MQVADISKTRQDGLAKVVRGMLRKRGIRRVKCVFSPENPIKGSKFEIPYTQKQKYKRSYYGTMSYMPAVMGMHAAAHVIRQVSLRGVGDLSTESQHLNSSEFSRQG
jgi:tRNA threonylcarbamoyladenosine dehydratase